MPNYSAESLSDARARDIYAYIRTFTSGQPPLDRIPVMERSLEAAEKPYRGDATSRQPTRDSSLTGSS